MCGGVRAIEVGRLKIKLLCDSAPLCVACTFFPLRLFSCSFSSSLCVVRLLVLKGHGPRVLGGSVEEMKDILDPLAFSLVGTNLTQSRPGLCGLYLLL